MQQAQAKRSNVFTVLSLAFLAYATGDCVHEILGHGLAAHFLGVRILGLSTIGLQTATSNRLVAAAGPVANILLGAVLLGPLRQKRFITVSYFLWLFGFLNLMNGIGYLMASAVLGSGDWAVAFDFARNGPVARILVGLAGVAGYISAVRLARESLRFWIAAGELAPPDIPRLTVPPYIAGGLLFTVASIFNPVGPQMILASGVAASFGLTFGLLFMRFDNAATPAGVQPTPLGFELNWILLGLAAAAVFVCVLGPGIRPW